MVMEEDQTLNDDYTIQYADDVSRLYISNLYNFINQCNPNKFNGKNKNNIMIGLHDDR